MMPSIDIIDDLEDGNGEIDPRSSPKRDGYWSTFNDGTKPDAGSMATQSPTPGGTFVPSLLSSADAGVDPGDTSLFAARTWGTGFRDWGAAMAFDLNATSTTKSTYDASASSGFTFLGRAAAGSGTTLYVRFVDKNTAPDGKVCTTCEAYFQKKITLTTTWQRYWIPFCDLIQPSWGVPQERAVDAAAIYSIQFQVPGSPIVNIPFDVWIDDVGFYKLP